MKKHVLTTEPEIIWRHCARIEPGNYPAYSRSAKAYFDHQFKRWVCVVQFDILDDARTKLLARITWYLNLGSGERPRASRRSNYWTAWVKASGRQPKRADRLTPHVFEKRYALVAVADTTKTHAQAAITSEESYSVVREVLTWETGGNQR